DAHHLHRHVPAAPARLRQAPRRHRDSPRVRTVQLANVANRRIESIQIWVEYRFGDADRKGGAIQKVPIRGITDLLNLPPSLPATAPDLTDGAPHSLHAEVMFEGGHVAYWEIGQLGGAFGGLSMQLDEMPSGQKSL